MTVVVEAWTGAGVGSETGAAMAGTTHVAVTAEVDGSTVVPKIKLDCVLPSLVL